MIALRGHLLVWIGIILCQFIPKLHATAAVAVIKLSTLEETKEMVYESHKTIIDLKKLFLKLQSLTANALSTGVVSMEDRDLFHEKKNKMMRKLNQCTLVLRPFYNTELAIQLIDDDQHLSFILPNLYPQFKQLAQTQINTITQAQTARLQLIELISQIESILPTENTESELNRFNLKSPSVISSTIYPATIIIRHLEDKEMILQSLIRLRQETSYQLHRLLHLVQSVLDISHSELELDLLNDEYQQTLKSFEDFLANNQLSPSIKLYNDITLSIRMNKQHKKYFFPLLNLQRLHLEDAELTEDIALLVSIYHAVLKGHQWTLNWLITGNSLPMN